MFILVLEIVFLFTKDSRKINGLNIFDKTFIYAAYADDTTPFLKDTKSFSIHFRSSLDSNQIKANLSWGAGSTPWYEMY